jgi:hypothetical protein
MTRTISGSLVTTLRRIVFLFGFVTGALMAGLGTAIRIGGSIPDGPLAAWFGVPLFEAGGLLPGRIGWMLVLEGLFLVAAMCAVAARNHWGWWSTAAAGLIAVLFFPGGTLAGVIVLLALAVRLIHEKPWKHSAERGAAP